MGWWLKNGDCKPLTRNKHSQSKRTLTAMQILNRKHMEVWPEGMDWRGNYALDQLGENMTEDELIAKADDACIFTNDLQVVPLKDALQAIKAERDKWETIGYGIAGSFGRARAKWVAKLNDALRSNDQGKGHNVPHQPLP